MDWGWRRGTNYPMSSWIFFAEVEVEGGPDSPESKLPFPILAAKAQHMGLELQNSFKEGSWGKNMAN